VGLYPDVTPRPVQAAIDDIPADLLRLPSLTVIEAPTGEGKTEAALALAHRIGALRGCDAFYYALPTMATSNQMFGRVNGYLRTRLDLPAGARLVHGQAHLLADHLPLRPMANGEQDEVAATLDWFAPRKRALLSSFGVGTIDQVELAVLNVRHVALRCAGLAGKTVIIDEVHAYDTYMTTIIERLLTWLRALDASVILLSATLPAPRLRALAAAWGVAVDDAGPALAAYPQLRVFGGGQAHTATPPAHQLSREIDLAWLGYAAEDAAGKATWLLERAAAGGCLCWITNTVAQAQALYRELRQRAPADLPLTLIHSRFPLARREALEHEIAAAYGPESPAVRRGIVVGTQVLEQSLDLDFDVMVSDLAPVDLLLQRSGRLHRHERPGRPVAEPVLYVNVARDAAGVPEWGVNAVIYDEYVLRRTAEALAARAGAAAARRFSRSGGGGLQQPGARGGRARRGAAGQLGGATGRHA
jgi:CRISPR-associated endonuclease/helicase Cas3